MDVSSSQFCEGTESARRRNRRGSEVLVIGTLELTEVVTAGNQLVNCNIASLFSPVDTLDEECFA